MVDDIQLHANVTSFAAIHCSLLNAELEEEKQEVNYDFCSSEIGLLETRGVLIKNVEVTGMRSEFGACIVEFTRNLPKKPTHPIAVRRGDVVSIWFYDREDENKKTYLATGTVVKISDVINVSFDNSSPFAWDFDNKYLILKTVSEIAFLRMRRALKNLENELYGRCSAIIRTFFANAELEKCTLPPDLVNEEGELKLFNKGLNREQKEAVKFCLEQKNVAIVHGPPGTGKTTVLVEVILQLVNSGQKVLVCAPSNIAVDIYVEKLSAIKSKVIRTGRLSRMLETSKESSLEVIMSRCEEGVILQDVQDEMKLYESKLKRADSHTKFQLREEIKQLRSEFLARQVRMIQNLLKNANVILSTLVSASDDGDFRHIPSDHFDVVIIDECSQALEASCWIVIPKAPKIILGGDHLQLPPTVKSSYAKELGLGTSLMERAISKFGSDSYRLLTHQYRMNTSIMEWVNKSFYSNKLIADISVAECLLKDLPGVKETVETETSLLWVDTAGYGVQESQFRGSKCNDTEGDVVALLVHRLVNAGIRESDLAVITPYALQVECIKSKITVYPDVEVRTVDGFQGREKQAVIISLVRANDQKELGFVTNKRRLNVAVSRAQFFLGVVGDTSVIQHSHVINMLWKYIEEHGLYFTAQELSEEIDQMNLPTFDLRSEKDPKNKSKYSLSAGKKKETATDIKKSIHCESEPAPGIKTKVHVQLEPAPKINKPAQFDKKTSEKEDEMDDLEKNMKNVLGALPKGTTSEVKITSEHEGHTEDKKKDNEVNEDNLGKKIKHNLGARPKEIPKSRKNFPQRPDVSEGSDSYHEISEPVPNAEESREEDKKVNLKKKEKVKQFKKEQMKCSRSRSLDDLVESNDHDEGLKAIEESMTRKSSCFIKGCMAYTKLLLQLCEHCKETFCISHLQPEIHGCGEAAKCAAKHKFKAFHDHSKKSKDEDRKTAMLKLKGKVDQLASERKRHSKK